MSRSSHVCKYWKPSPAGHRGFRRCDFCGRRQTKHGGEWADVMQLGQFANKWLPALSGTDPMTLMVVETAFPFEWNCYESWNVVYRVRFDFTALVGRALETTRVNVMSGWTSPWRETFNAIDADARNYYQEQMGAPYQIGDNAYEEMRRIIQS